MTVSIRPATENDQPQIVALARGERIKPFGLDWPNFVVAEQSGRLVGAVQLRRHGDGSLELGSLVVAGALRKQGIAGKMIERRLEGATGRIMMITGRRYADHYKRWGFVRIAPSAAPRSIRLHYWAGHFGGRVASILQCRAFNPLAVLDRAAPAELPRT
jgi:N-acetylglutamate synthase-like GNAT family acetyltransferase